MTRYQTIELSPTRVVVAREKRQRGDGPWNPTLVPVMTFSSLQAAQIWVSGQYELNSRGAKAGYPTRAEAAPFDAVSDTFALG